MTDFSLEHKENKLLELQSRLQELESELHQLKAENNRLKSLLNASPDLFIRLDKSGNYIDIYSNPFGLQPVDTPDSLLGKNITEVFPADFASFVLSRIEEALQTGKAIHFEYAIPGFDDYFECWMVKVDDEQVIASIKNISYKKLQERILKENELRLKALAENSPAIIWMTDAHMQVTYISEAWTRFTGASIFEVEKNWMNFIHPDDIAGIRKIVKDAFIHKQSIEFHFRAKNKDGKYRWIYNKAQPLWLDDGEFIGYVGIAIDITDREEANQRIRKSEKQKSLLLKFTAALASAGLDFNRVMQTIAEQMLAIGADVCNIAFLDDSRPYFNTVAYTYSDKTGSRFYDMIFSKQIPAAGPYLGKILKTGKPVKVKKYDIKRRLHEGNRPLWDDILKYGPKSFYYFPVKFQGEVQGVIVISKTREGEFFSEEEFELIENMMYIAQVHIENLLLHKNLQTAFDEKESSERKALMEKNQLQILTNALPFLVLRLDEEDRCRFANQTMAFYAGMDINDMAGKQLSQIIGRAEYRKLKPFINKMRKGERVAFEHTHTGLDGEQRELFIQLIPLKYEPEHTFTEYLLVAVDITERLRFERKLQESEARWRSIFENAPDIINLLDNQGRILSINRLEPGYDMDKVIGRDFRSFLLPEYLPLVDKHFKYVLTTGNSTAYEVKQFNPTTNSYIWYNTVASPVIQDGKVEYVILIARDITSLKNLESERIKYVIEAQERERERMAMELHDGLGQPLAAVKMGFDALRSSIKDLPEYKLSLVDQIYTMLDNAIKEFRTVAHNMMPYSLHDYGLTAAIENMIKQVNVSGKLQISFDHDLKDNDLPPAHFQSTIYRILQELLRNTLQHANARHVRIHLKNNKNSLQIFYQDDGKGFDPEEAQLKGIGLRNIRNRVDSLKGNIRFQSPKRGGLRVIIEIPVEVNQ